MAYWVLLLLTCAVGACNGRRVQTTVAASQPSPEVIDSIHTSKLFLTEDRQLEIDHTPGASLKVIKLFQALKSSAGFSPSSPGSRPAVGSPDSRRLARLGEGVQLAAATGERLDKLTIKVLKDKLKSRGLKLSGKKADLVARLEEPAAAGEQSEADETSSDEAESSSEVGTDIGRLTLADLKARLKASGLKVSGKKADLLARLKRHAEAQDMPETIDEQPERFVIDVQAPRPEHLAPVSGRVGGRGRASAKVSGRGGERWQEPPARRIVPNHMHLFRSKVSAFQSLRSWAEAFSAGMDETSVSQALVQLGARWRDEPVDLEQVAEDSVFDLEQVPGNFNIHLGAAVNDGIVSAIHGTADAQIGLGLLAFLARALRGTKIEDVLAIDLEAFSQMMAEHGLVAPSTEDAEVFKSMMSILQQQLSREGHRKSTNAISAERQLSETSTATAGLSQSRWSGVGGEGEVAVLLSGGVDSCVALQLALESGLKPRAFYLKIWLEEHVDDHPWFEDFQYAFAMAAQAGVPLEVVSLQDVYWDLVAKEALEQSKAGLSPNAEFICNFKVKFGLFYDLVGKQFDKIVTGHYAKVRPVEGEEGKVGLFLADDIENDQSYMLSNITQEQLRKVFFPLGDLQRGSVQEIAVKQTLPAMPRPDKARRCLLGKAKWAEFNEMSLADNPGPLKWMPEGQVIGRHRGLHLLGMGTKKVAKHFSLADFSKAEAKYLVGNGPWKVVHKDIDSNEVVIVTQRFYDKSMVDYRSKFSVNAINWISGQPPEGLSIAGGYLELDVQLRRCRTPWKGNDVHRAALVERSADEEGVYHIKLRTLDRMPTPGQTAAFYQGDRCLGAGVIRPRSESELHELFPEVEAETSEAARSEGHFNVQAPDA